MIGVRTASGDAAIGVVSILTPGGAKTIARMSILTSGGDAVLFDSAGGGGGGVSVSLGAFDALGSVMNGATTTVTTNEITASVLGGTPPYTFAWAKLAGGAGWLITAETSSATRFQYSTVDPYDEQSGEFQVTVTDARARTATATINATVYNYGSFA